MTLSTDAIDLKFGADGDLVIENGDIVFSTGVDAVVQNLQLALQLVRGEWFLDLDEGVPWMANDIVPEDQAILGGKFNELKARLAIRDAILSAPGVTELRTLEVSFESATRTLVVTFGVRTEFGDSDTLSLEIT